MDDLATLGIKVDASQVDAAIPKLDRLAQAGGGAEAATDALGQSAKNASFATYNFGEALDKASSRVLALKGSVDPFGAAMAKANAEIAEANSLHRLGAISADEHAAALSTLTMRAEMYSEKQRIANSLINNAGKNAKLTSNEMLNFSRQMADVGVTAAMGMNPLMIAVQQGPQIAEIFQLAAMRGMSASQVFKAMGEAALGAGRAMLVAIAPALPVLAAVGVAAAAIGGAFALGTRAANQEIGKNIDHLKLNEKQLKKLKDESVNTGVTMGDTFRGVGKTITDALTAAFGPTIASIKKRFNDFLDEITKNTVNEVKTILGAFIGGFYAIRDTWKMLPAAMADIVATSTNFVIDGINATVKKAIDGINSLVPIANAALAGMGSPLRMGQLGQAPTISRVANENAGAASAAARVGGDAMARGNADAGRMVDGVIKTTMGNIREARDERVTKAAGEAGPARAGRKGAQSDADKELEKQTEAAEDFIKSLKEETAEIGKNELQVRRLAAERAMALAPTKDLKDGIKAAADEWERATVQFKNDELRKSLADTADELKFETSLIGMNAKEREVAQAQREIDLQVRALEREGISVNRDAIAAETAAIIANAEARGQLQLDVDNANDFADKMGKVASNVREAASAFGDLFGSAGQALGDLTSIIVDFDAKQAESIAALAEARQQYGEDSIKYKEMEATATADAAQAEIAHYGDMLGAAKGFFGQKTAAFKVLEAAERAYRIYQFAMAVQEMVTDATVTGSKVANSATRMATDGAETASSVAKSGIRAAADGVAAFAKTLASLPFPFNLAAGAAVIAALVGVGVAMRGGGGGKASATTAAQAEEQKPSSYSPFTSHDTGQYVAGNDNRISPSYGGAPQMVGGKTLVVQFNGNISGNDPEETKRQIRETFANEIQPVVMADAREQTAQDLASLSRSTLGGR